MRRTIFGVFVMLTACSGDDGNVAGDVQVAAENVSTRGPWVVELVVDE